MFPNIFIKKKKKPIITKNHRSQLSSKVSSLPRLVPSWTCSANLFFWNHVSGQVDGHGAETGPELDEEMEKVFAMDTGEKFDVARLGSPSESAGSDRERERGPPSRYGDRDFNRTWSRIRLKRVILFQPPTSFCNFCNTFQ